MLLLSIVLLTLIANVTACPSAEEHPWNQTLSRRWYSVTAGDEEVWPSGDVWWCYTPPNPVETYDPYHRTDVSYVKEAMEVAFKKWNPKDEIKVQQLYCGTCPCQHFKNALNVVFEPPGYSWRAWMGYNVRGLPGAGHMKITWEGASESVRDPYWQRMFVSLFSTVLNRCTR